MGLRLSPSLIAATILVSCLVSPALADFSGSVISILNGDTIKVLHNKKAERISLQGIDCPEKGQLYGNRAKNANSDLTFAKSGTVESLSHDKHKRTLGAVYLSDGTNVNRQLVIQGWWGGIRGRKYGVGSLYKRLEERKSDARNRLPTFVLRSRPRFQAHDISA